MAAESSLKKDWTVTPEAFNAMLRWLDPSPDAAGEKYEKIRQKLLKLFKWRNCFPEEEYADITINRVTRRVYEKTPEDASNPYTYFHGTALNVLREYWRTQQKRTHQDIDSADPSKLAVGDADDEMDRDNEVHAEEKRYGCMRECILGLPADSRELIVSYHHGDNKKAVRSDLAEKLGITINVLRIRACRIRESLQSCVGSCVRKIA